jgi:hypothetical protein
MLVTRLKIKILIKAYEMTQITLLPLSLIIGKLTLILNLTSQKVFC